MSPPHPGLATLRPYPFDRLRELLQGIEAPPDLIDLAVGEPKHAVPEVARQALSRHAELMGRYPPVTGTSEFRRAVADWSLRRYGLAIDPDRQVLPLAGSREGLFSVVQALASPGARVAVPNPFYQIYEGAALLAGAEVQYINIDPATGKPDYRDVEADIIFVCSPGNPTGAALTQEEWQEVVAVADRQNAILIADECYSEIYRTNAAPPAGLLASVDPNRGFQRLLSFNSLSKRSNLAGLRVGWAAGDPELLATFARYRAYHGAAPSLLSLAVGAAALEDEIHVNVNRSDYDNKFADAAVRLDTDVPEAGFFVWYRVPRGDSEKFTQRAYAEAAVRLLPGGYLSRETNQGNPGATFVRIALVPSREMCDEAFCRLASIIAA